MRIRRGSVFVSSVLLTFSLLPLIPQSLKLACSSRLIQQSEQVRVTNLWVPLGFAELALCLVGLIVIWTEYVDGARWAWVSMFIVVWVFAFPVMVLPILQDTQWTRSIAWSELLGDALEHAALGRAVVLTFLEFALMMIALFLPIRSFFKRKPTSP